MTDSAIFLLVSTRELPNSGHLPGDIRGLRSHLDAEERAIHLEVISDNPLSEKTANSLGNAGAIQTVLPSATDTQAALVAGLMARLHEFICTYPQVGRIILAGAEVDRLILPSQFLQKAGYLTTILGPDKSRLDAVRHACDDVAHWSGGRNSSGGGGGRDRDRDRDREDASSSLDPYEVLVEEVTKSREKGRRVLLTSLKQRMRRRLRRFDETKLKDLEGRPMRKFKDFIEDAVNRELIQLVERGNRSQVLLPDEDIPPEQEEDSDEETSGKREASGKGESSGKGKASANDASGDPLLDAVDTPEDSEPETLGEADFDVGTLNEDADAPTKEFMVFLDNTLPEKGMTLPEMLSALSEAQENGSLQLTNRELQSELQNAFYNELLEPAGKESPTRFVVVDDWRDIIDFL